jgi:hypothetical protein
MAMLGTTLMQHSRPLEELVAGRFDVTESEL